MNVCLLLLCGVLFSTGFSWAQEEAPNSLEPKLAEEAAEAEMEKEWAVLAHPEDLEVTHFLNLVLLTLHAEHQAEEKSAELLRSYQALLAEEAEVLREDDLLKLNRVRSTQVTDYGVFPYRDFACRFQPTEQGLFFEKTAGSQRKSGLLFPHDEQSWVFLGGSTVNDEPQRSYSGLQSQPKSPHDAVGLVVKRQGRVVMVFFEGSNRAEFYEFRKAK